MQVVSVPRTCIFRTASSYRHRYEEAPHIDIGMRRQLLQIYKEENSKNLCSNEVQKHSDVVYTTNFRRFSLQEYIHVHSVYCNANHAQPCSQCKAVLFIANTVATDGYCRLSVVFKNAFPTLSYKADIARQKVLQMPLACIRLGSSEKGTSSWFLIM